MVTPKLHTSLLLENLQKLIDSGAYHFRGHIPAVRACGSQKQNRQQVNDSQSLWASR